VDTSDERVVRYLGLAFLAVFATSLAAGLLGDAAMGGDGSPLLGRVSEHLAVLRASNLLWLITGIGIIALAALLYAVLGDVDRPLALIAFGWWLAEGTMLAVGALGMYGLLAVGAGTIGAAAPGPEREALAGLFLGLQQSAFTVHMLFFCLGGLAWYGLMLRSRLVPRWLAAWGMAGVALLLANMVVVAWDRGLDLGVLGMIAMLVYVPFEPVLGVWLLVRGAGARAVRPAQLSGIRA
jgi:hypothetical protein